MAITKVSGHVIEPTTNITSHNINSSGIITATRFDGPLGVGLTNGNFSGIVTTAQLNVSGVSTFTGNVSIGSSLLFADNKKAIFGDNAGGYLEVYNSGADSIIKSNTDDLWIYAHDNIFLAGATSNHKYLRTVNEGTVALYFNNNQKFETTNTGTITTGICSATDFSGVAGGAADFPNGLTGTTATFSGTVSIGGTLTYEDVTNIDSVGIVTARSGVYIPADNKYLKIGASNQLGFVHTGGSSYITNSTGHLVRRSDVHKWESYDGSSEYARFDSSGRLLTGHTAAYGSGKAQVFNTAQYVLDLSTWSADANGPTVDFYKSRNATIGSSTIVQDDDVIGRLRFLGNDGANSRTAAQITAEVDGTPGTNDMPGRLIFSTTPDNSTSITERLRIDKDGHITPGAAGTQDLGSTSKEFRHLYLGDDGKVQLGSDQDFTIQHDGSHLYLDTGTGLFYSDATAHIIRNKAGNQDVAKFNEGASGCMLYCSNGVKLTTTTTGITVGGEVAASQDYPNYQPTLDFNFTTVKKLDPRITYYRDGPASYIDELGRVVLVGDNTPRFDHDPDTRESKGLLIEVARTNLIPHSFDNGNWGAGSNGTLTRDAGIAPDGTMTATKASTTSNDIDTSPQLGQASPGATGQVAINGGSVYTLSIWAKASTPAQVGNNFKVRWKRVQGDNVFTETTFALTANWKRYSTTATTAANNSTIACYIGGVANSEALVWGAQLEAGSHTTSLIPTHGRSATRAGDVAIIDGTEFTDFFNATEGTSVVHAHMPVSSGASGLPSYAFKNSAVSSVNLGLWRDNNASPAYHYYHDGTNSGFARASATGDNMYKGAMSFKTSDLDSYVNGSANTNTTTFTMPTIDNLRFGGVGGANQLSGHIARFMYYPVKLPNNQLATLTS